MLRMIELTKINKETRGGVGLDEDEIPTIAPPTVDTSPMMVNVEQIREIYERRDNRPGTRIVFTNGAGWPVTESYDEVRAKINGVSN